MLIGTSSTLLPVDNMDAPALQNLGPGALYFAATSPATTTDGFKVPAGAVYEFPRTLAAAGISQLFAIADAANTDLRILKVG